MLHCESRHGGQLDRQPLGPAPHAVDKRWKDNRDFGSRTQRSSRLEDGQVDLTVRRVVGQRVDVVGLIVGEDLASPKPALGVIAQLTRAARVDVHRGPAVAGAFLHAAEHGFHRGQVVGRGGVNDDVAGHSMLFDERFVVQRADDGFTAPCLKGCGVGIAAHQRGHCVAFLEQEGEDLGAYEAGSDQKDPFGICHPGSLALIWASLLFERLLGAMRQTLESQYSRCHWRATTLSSNKCRGNECPTFVLPALCAQGCK